MVNKREDINYILYWIYDLATIGFDKPNSQTSFFGIGVHEPTEHGEMWLMDI